MCAPPRTVSTGNRQGTNGSTAQCEPWCHREPSPGARVGAEGAAGGGPRVDVGRAGATPKQVRPVLGRPDSLDYLSPVVL
jgi:hypothetical protein